MDLPAPSFAPNIGFNGLKLTGYVVEGSSSRHTVQISWESNSSNAMHPKEFLIERMNDGLDFLLNPRDKTRYAYLAIDSPFMGPSDEFMIIYQELDAGSYKEVIDYLLSKKPAAILGKSPKKYLIIVDQNIASYETLIATMKQFKLQYFTNVHEALVDAFIP
jgi:hypothetical protein